MTWFYSYYNVSTYNAIMALSVLKLLLLSAAVQQVWELATKPACAPWHKPCPA
jgi:hypothetical protein